LDQFVACFEGLEDPRTGNAGLHDFHELLIIALCGGQGATHTAAFAVAKEPFLRGFLKLDNGPVLSLAEPDLHRTRERHPDPILVSLRRPSR
jgi:hypothetical protein